MQCSRKSPPSELVRLKPDGARATLAGSAEGMKGATVAFGRREADRRDIYVSTIGGTWFVPKHELEPARLVRVDVGMAVHPLPGQT